MSKSKIHSDEMKSWYRGDLKAILLELQDGKKCYTHHFEFIGQYNFTGKDQRPHLRKCLRTLEADGLVENFNRGMNIHQWRITAKGIQFLADNALKK